MTQTILSRSEVMVESKLSPTVNIVETGENIDSFLSADEQDRTVNTINDLLLERLERIRNEPLVGYPASTRDAGDYAYYTPQDLDRFTDGAVIAFTEQGLQIHVSLTYSMNFNIDLTMSRKVGKTK